MSGDKSCKTPRWRLLKAQLNNLNPKDFYNAIKTANRKVIIIDVRTPTEYENNHIANAINIDYLHEDFWREIEQLNDNDKSIFVYCRTGRRSIRACTLMRNGGFDNQKIFNLDGGFEEWVKKISKS